MCTSGGGPIMHPLLFVSILALAVILERTLFIVSETRKRDPKALQSVFAAVESGRVRRCHSRRRPVEGLRRDARWRTRWNTAIARWRMR